MRKPFRVDFSFALCVHTSKKMSTQTMGLPRRNNNQIDKCQGKSNILAAALAKPRARGHGNVFKGEATKADQNVLLKNAVSALVWWLWLLSGLPSFGSLRQRNLTVYMKKQQPQRIPCHWIGFLLLWRWLSLTWTSEQLHSSQIRNKKLLLWRARGLYSFSTHKEEVFCWSNYQ